MDGGQAGSLGSSSSKRTLAGLGGGGQLHRERPSRADFEGSGEAAAMSGAMGSVRRLRIQEPDTPELQFVLPLIIHVALVRSYKGPALIYPFCYYFEGISNLEKSCKYNTDLFFLNL